MSMFDNYSITLCENLIKFPESADALLSMFIGVTYEFEWSDIEDMLKKSLGISAEIDEKIHKLIRNTEKVYLVRATNNVTDDSYVVGIFSKKEEAIAAAMPIKASRGTTYLCTVLEYTLNSTSYPISI